MTRGEDFFKNAKSSHGHRSAMSNSAWCDLNKNCTVLRLHDMCHNPKCKTQKQNTFTPKQFQLEGGLIKSELHKILREHEQFGMNFKNRQLMQQHRLLVWLLVLRLKTLKLDKQRLIY